jgi:hypothetical protein
MVIGAALISIPIIIHLINRMRFKRIRWAAMEFLLKAQKRNRRRLIIEQLILLALRCLLIALTGFLLARYIGHLPANIGSQGTEYLVVLDDSLSMNDHWKEQGEADRTSFDLGKQRVLEIAREAAQATPAPHFQVLRLSDMNAPPIFDARLNGQAVEELRQKLDNERSATLLRLKPSAGFKAANEILAKSVEGKQSILFVSDFREQDWNGADTDLTKELDTLTGKGVDIYLVDSAHPYRSESQPAPTAHGNLAITDLRPETRIVSSEGVPIEFTLTVANFSRAEKKNVFLKVFINGQESFSATTPLPDIPTSGLTHKFQLGFTTVGYAQVTAKLVEANDQEGLEADNIRHTMVLVVNPIRILIVDGGYTDPLKPTNDTLCLETALNSTKGYKIDVRGVDELDKANLDDYRSIYLLNVPRLKSDKQLKNLEGFVKRGGRVALFVGDKVESDFYNKDFYKEGNGLFPVPLADKPSNRLTTAERSNQLTGQQTLLFIRDPNQQIFAGLNFCKEALNSLIIDQYFPTKARALWAHKPGEGVVQELATLPSRKTLSEYSASAAELVKRLPIDSPAYAKYRSGLEFHADRIRKSALPGNALFQLANSFNALLYDGGNPKDPGRPNLVEFWSLPDPLVRQLHSDLEQFRDEVQYGDPLVLLKRFGKGRVVVFLTTAGRSWNDWAGGCPAEFTYPMVMGDLQRYLTASSDELGDADDPAGKDKGNTSDWAINDDQFRLVGGTVTLQRELSRYQPNLTSTFTEGLPPVERVGVKPDPKAKDAPGQAVKDQVAGVTSGKDVLFTLKNTQTPGMVTVEFKTNATADGKAVPEMVAYIFNLDAAGESNLRRAPRDVLEREAPKSGSQGALKLVAGDTDLREFRQRHRDLSESPWLYLIFLVILIIEQALAVHLSFHLKSGETALPGQAVGPQATAA